jgi:hypothetical protein
MYNPLLVPDFQGITKVIDQHILTILQKKPQEYSSANLFNSISINCATLKWGQKIKIKYLKF